jgi:hypothetical protein
MANKKQILNSIAGVAKELGRPPRRSEFISRSGIALHVILRSFPSWSRAIRAAGLPPYTLSPRLQERALLEDWGRVVRKNSDIFKYRARLPRHIYRRQGKYSPHTLANRFGAWSSVPRTFCKFANGKREWADVVALVRPGCIARASLSRDDRQCSSKNAVYSIPPKKVQHSLKNDRASYGNPLPLPGFRHEPVNEQGVLVLFGMVAKELGYIVEAVQAGFPDCEAKRRIGPERWQQVKIEFEFESRNFRDHAHPLTGCDVIVCWRHNWPECPAHIEVLELSTAIESLPTSAD